MQGSVDDARIAASLNAEQEVAAFVACVFEPDDIVEVRCLRKVGDKPEVDQSWHPASSLVERTRRFVSLKGWNIYVGVNPRPRKGAKGDDCIQMARMLFVDFDGGCTFEEARWRWEAAGLPEPTLVIHSGHGIHAYWRLAQPLTDLPMWTRLQRQLIAAVKSDPSIHNPERIMRLPRFPNVKSEPHVPCFILESNPERQYDFARLSNILERVNPQINGCPKIAPPSHAAYDESVISRARDYVGCVPNVSKGERNQAAFRVAAILVNDFGLPEIDAKQLLREWNMANNPPLDEGELARVLQSSGKYAKKPHACKASVTLDASVASVAHGADDSSIESDPWPDPLDQAAFHGLTGELVGMIEPHSEADPAALLVQALVAFGSVIGRSAFFRAEADTHYGNMFTCLVGVTSKGRKGSSWGQTSRPFSSVDSVWANNRVQGGLSSGEGLIWAVRDPIYKREPMREGGKAKGRIVGYEDVEVDPGVADKRLLVLEAEFGSVLKVIARERNTLSAIIRNAWDTGSLRTLTKNSPAQATDAHISIVGHITRNELRRQLCETDMANGLANRFLWICVKRSKCLPEGGELQSVDFTSVVNGLRDAVLFAQNVGEVRRTKEARAIWYEVYPELSEGKAGLLGSATSRAEAQVMRLAMLYALLDRMPDVGAQHLLAALALWQYAEQSAQYIFGSSLGDPVADELLRVLRAKLPDGMTRTEMRDHFGRHKPAEIGRALAVLLEDGRVYRGKSQATGGRPSEVWFAVDHATKATKATKVIGED